MDAFDATRGEIMLLIVLAQILMGLFAPIAGRWMDTLNIRVLIICGAIGLALAYTLISFATALWQIAVLYASLIAIAGTLSGPLPAQTLAARWFNARRGTAIGLVSVGTSLGGVLLPIFVAIWLTDHDWRFAHQMLALAVLFGIAPIVWLVVRNSPQEAGVDPEPDHPLTTSTSYPTWTTAELVKSRAFIMLIVAVIPMTMATGAMQQNLAPFARDLAITPTAIATLVSIMSAVMIGGKVFFGMMADRWDHRWLFLIALAATYFAIGLFLSNPSYTLLTLAVGSLGFGMGGFLPLVGAYIAYQFGPATFGRAMGLLGPFFIIGAVGPLIAGYLRDASTSYDLAWIVFSVVLIPSGIAFLALPTERLQGDAS